MSSLLITIGKLNPDGSEALKRYAAGVIPLIEAAGGVVLARGNPKESIVGNSNGRPDLVAVMRFADDDSIRSFLSSEAYLANVPHRNLAFREIHTYIAADLM
jgi:uncharacterized protein (DUF1330 family)